jgi:hypothetical protein
VGDVLTRLADQGELLAVPTKPGKRPRYAYKKTEYFAGGEPIDLEAQRQAAELLQGLAVVWGNRRNEARAADHAAN